MDDAVRAQHAPRDLVSVIIPTRNRRADLEQAIRSALDQRDVDLEVIVVDEASDDGTPELLAHFRDDRVRTVRHDTPKGPAAARNAGVEAANGDWIAFLDDDDLWAPGKLAMQLTAMREAGADWSFTSCVMIDQSLNVIGSIAVPQTADVYRRLLLVNVVPGTPGVVVKADLFHKVGGMRAEYKRVEDWDLWIRLAQQSEPVMIDRPLWVYRVSRGSSSHATDETVEATGRLRAEFAPERDRLHIVEDPIENDLYLARQDARSGRGVAAAKRFASVAFRARRPKLLLRASLVAMSPRLVESLGWRQSAKRVPAAWRADVQSWLPAYRNR
ncbi:MAG: glycosyltransferase family 2 protein [Acidimicrobiia bacterium]